MYLEPSTIVLLTLAGSLLLFLTDALRYDVVALLVVLVLAGTRCLSPQDAFAGFSSKAVILIASMYVFSAAIGRWGVAEAMGQRLLANLAGGETRLCLQVMLVTGLLSGFLSNTGVVAIMIPIVTAVARDRRIPVSTILIPLSYASLVGGLLSLVATSKNVAVNERLGQMGSEPWGLFEFTPYGLLMLALATAFMTLVGRRMLPRGRVAEGLAQHYQVPKFVTEVLVEPNSTMINRTVGDIERLAEIGVSVLGIVRDGEESIMAPGPYNRIRRADTLVLQGEPEAILRAQKSFELKLVTSARAGDIRLDSSDVRLIEVVVPSGSRLVGHTLVEAEFEARTGLNVLGLSSGGEIEARLGQRRLVVGDTLLIQGHEHDIERARRDREVLVLGEVPKRLIGRGGLVTLGLLLGVLVAAGTHLMPLSVAALAGAIGLVLFRCIPIEEAYRAIDFMVLVMIGGMLALGLAFKSSGLAEDIAQWVFSIGAGTPDPRLLLAVILIATALLTQVATHIAAALIMTEVSAELAVQMGISDRAFVMGVLTAASCAFMSPVAHVANAMVVGPGDYRYRDFLKVGTPLTLFILVAAWLVLPVFWPF